MIVFVAKPERSRAWQTYSGNWPLGSHCGGTRVWAANSYLKRNICNLLGHDFVNELAVHGMCVTFCDLWGRNIDNVKMLRVTNITGV